jgi:hypothetical protein
MVLHVWFEQDERMRVRITRTLNVRSGRTETAYARNTAETLRIIEQSLAELQGRTPEDG